MCSQHAAAAAVAAAAPAAAADRYPAAKMRAFAEQLHANGQHWVPILNPGVGTQKGFAAYEDGNKDDIWIKDYTGKKPYLGQVQTRPGPFEGIFNSAFSFLHLCCIQPASTVHLLT
jgi:hypothetical protein